MKRNAVVGFLWGIVAAIAGQMVLAEFDRRTVTATALGLKRERCPYMFPWSGQCTLNNHHEGRHF